MARGGRGRQSGRQQPRNAGAAAPQAPQPSGAYADRRARGRGHGNRGPVVRDVSAGGVVFRRSGQTGSVEVALVGRLRPKRWALPKGTPQVGETLEETAVREVGEETGLLARIIQPLEEIQYWFVWGALRHFKTVHFYLMEMTGGDTANHDGEYDVVEWFPIAEALRHLSYPNEARVVEKAMAVLAPTADQRPPNSAEQA